MELKAFADKHTSLWAFGLPALFVALDNIASRTTLLWLSILTIILTLVFLFGLIIWTRLPSGGRAWNNGRNRMGRVTIPGPRGLPVFGSLFTLSQDGLAHRTLSSMASSHGATQLMALSLGNTPVVVSSDPRIAREILTSPWFADRPVKQSAKQLMFSRAIGFASSGTYWRMLRRVASSHLFSPRRILAHESGRQLGCATMLGSIFGEQVLEGCVSVRKHLQIASLNNIMDIVFGKRYDLAAVVDIDHENEKEAEELYEVVKEGFELLGAFNWSDHLPWLQNFYDPCRIGDRCAALVPRVRRLVKRIIGERTSDIRQGTTVDGSTSSSSERSCFVDVLLSLDGEEKLGEDDIVAVLWEMIFRGTDTTALLTEWIMAELVLNPSVQSKLQSEIDSVVAQNPTDGVLRDSHLSKLHYLQAVVKEALRLHPPGPLLSWARLATSDQPLSNGMVVPAGTTAMVNMWAITHNPEIWEKPFTYKPERFMGSENIADNIDIRGFDLTLAPFGAGRRVCPGQNLAMATVSLWVAELVRSFKWVEDKANSPVDMGEVLKLSCEMKQPLRVVAIPRN